ncbi:MAG: DUF6282 family protein [Chloroflexota bacterium]
MAAVDKLIAGAIDMHVHFNPDSLQERRQDALKLAYSARDLGMRAIVLKCHDGNTTPVALLVSELVPEVRTFGSVTLDNEVGGLNPAAVLSAARMGARVVWMPTITAANSKARTEKTMGFKIPGPAQTILDTQGKLLPAAKEIFQIVKEYDIVLASGHLSPKETFALAEEAQKIGFAKMVVTHALQWPLVDTPISEDNVKQLAKSGAFIEHSFWGWMPTIANAADPKLIVASVKATGAGRCIMSSDFGQIYHPPAPEGLRLFITTMLRNGLTEQDIETMVKTNPANLLGLT